MIMKSGLGKIFLKSLHALTTSFLLLNFDQKYKFSNKKNMVSAWRNFKKFFLRPLFTIIFRPKILFFVIYSILTGWTKVEFVIYWVLRQVQVGVDHKDLSLSQEITPKMQEGTWNSGNIQVGL